MEVGVPGAAVQTLVLHSGKVMKNIPLTLVATNRVIRKDDDKKQKQCFTVPLQCARYFMQMTGVLRHRSYAEP